MGELTDLAEKGIAAAALEARERYDQSRKVLDEAAVKLEVRVECLIDGFPVRPPLAVVVNGERQTGEVNRVDSLDIDRRKLWVTVPIYTKGIAPIKVTLDPVAGAEAYFHPGSSPAAKFEAAYSRNTIEAHGGKFIVPPEEDTYEPHIVRIRIQPRLRSWWRPRRVEDIPHDWVHPSAWGKNEALSSEGSGLWEDR